MRINRPPPRPRKQPLVPEPPTRTTSASSSDQAYDFTTPGEPSMSSGILTLTQQPRWLLLSLFLILWSWSTGLRRDGKALGLGVDARAAPAWELRRLVGLPICAEQCALQAQEAIGCGDSLNLQCACHSAQFFPGAVDCMTANCTASDKQNGQDALMTACKAVGTSVSLPTSFTGTSTSITSGVPSISGSASTTATTSPSSASSTPSSGSGTPTATATTASGTATATATATAPPSSTTGTGTGSSTESGSSSGTTSTGTSSQASGSTSTPSSTSTSTGTSGSGNGAKARGASLSWHAVAVGVVLAVAGSVASL